MVGHRTSGRKPFQRDMGQQAGPDRQNAVIQNERRIMWRNRTRVTQGEVDTGDLEQHVCEVLAAHDGIGVDGDVFGANNVGCGLFPRINHAFGIFQNAKDVADARTLPRHRRDRKSVV